MINSVRATGARNIVVIGGLDWAYDLRGVDSGYALTDSSGNGIMYDAHVYPWKSNWDTYISCIADTNPILIGECGWDDPQWYRDTVDPNWHAEPYQTWNPKLLDWLDSHQYNWMAWCFHPSSTPNLLTDWNYNVSDHWGAYAKPRLQSYYGGAPTPTPTPEGHYELENLTVNSSSSDYYAIYNDAAASGGKYIRFDANESNDYVEYIANVPSAGTYNVKAKIKKGTDRGRYQLNINGANQGAVVDGYASSASFVEIDFGTVNFASGGDKLFRFTCTGKNSSSSSYKLYGDCITLD